MFVLQCGLAIANKISNRFSVLAQALHCPKQNCADERPQFQGASVRDQLFVRGTLFRNVTSSPWAEITNYFSLEPNFSGERAFATTTSQLFHHRNEKQKIAADF